MVYEKKAILEATRRTSAGSDDDSCSFCDRPRTDVYCESCSHTVTRVRVKKRCPSHPQVFNTMDLAKCPECRSTDLLEVGIDLDEIPRKSEKIPIPPLLSQGQDLKNFSFAPTPTAPLNGLAKASSPPAGSPEPSLIRPESGYGLSQEDVTMSPTASPERASSHSPIRFNLNAPSFSSQTHVLGFGGIKKVPDKQDSFPLDEFTSLQIGAPRNEIVKAEYTKRLESPKSRMSRVSLPSPKVVGIGKPVMNGTATSSGIPVGSSASVSQVDGRAQVNDAFCFSGFKVNPTQASSFTPFVLYSPSYSPEPTMQQFQLEVCPPNANLATVPSSGPISGNKSCICSREVRYVLCTSCGYYDGSGTIRKFIPCALHPLQKNGIKFCPECGQNAEKVIDEGLLSQL